MSPFVKVSQASFSGGQMAFTLPGWILAFLYCASSDSGCIHAFSAHSAGPLRLHFPGLIWFPAWCAKGLLLRNLYVRDVIVGTHVR